MADFGLSRVLTEGKEYYRVGNNKQLPVKWMAPESLTDFLFTAMSDIVRASISNKCFIISEIVSVVLWSDVVGSDDIC